MEFIEDFIGKHEHYKITYTGQIVSHNDIYGSNNWRVRKTIVDKYKKIFGYLFKEAKMPWFEQFGLVIHFNSKHDTDNISELGKLALDVFKEKREKGIIVQKGHVHDDTKKHSRLFCIVPDETLPINTAVLTFIKIC